MLTHFYLHSLQIRVERKMRDLLTRHKYGAKSAVAVFLQPLFQSSQFFQPARKAALNINGGADWNRQSELYEVEMQAAHVLNAGCSRSLMQISASCEWSVPILCIRSNGSAELHSPSRRALKIWGVKHPMCGFTSSKGISKGSGGMTFSTTSPLHVHKTQLLIP